ncbi:MAG: hypothetical protein ABW022_26455 [Actinoplanes sp.]
MGNTLRQLGLATNCHQNEPMADWHRLGQHVTARRIELGYRRREDLTTAFEGISQRTLGDIESGRREGYHRNTLATLEHALQWAPGSMNAILDGGEPVTQAPAGAPPAANSSDSALAAVMRSDKLTESDKAKIVKVLIAEQQRFERERAARAQELIQIFADGQ